LNDCKFLAIKAQSKHILDNSVANALSKHDVNFNFSHGGKGWNFATFEPFGGKTEKLTFILLYTWK
jgi:hypothetical protein